MPTNAQTLATGALLARSYGAALALALALFVLFTSAAARAGGALSRLFTWALFLAALVLLLPLRPGAGGTSGSSP